MKFIYLYQIRLAASFRFKTGSVIRPREITTMSKKGDDSSQPNICDGPTCHLDTATKVPLPTEWKTLETQVGGHQFTHGEYEHQKLGIVDLGNGLILKSLQNPPRGPRELCFYQKAFDPNCDDSDLLELRPFLSPFYGTEESGGAKFLKLANLTSDFKHPCVIDLKMGRVTYDQEATAEKIAHEVGKYPPLKMLGFQITGMMIYNPETQSNEQYGKPYCRDLTEENIVHDGLGRYFQLHINNLRRDAIQSVLSKLKKLQTWFLMQKKFSFIASSLLIVYEGSQSTAKMVETSEKTDLSSTDQNEDKNANNLTSIKDSSFSNTGSHSKSLKDSIKATAPNSCSTHVQKRISDGQLVFDDETVKKVKLSEVTSGDLSLSQNESCKTQTDVTESPTKEAGVHLIDFAHVFPANDIDHNFLFGLQNFKCVCVGRLTRWWKELARKKLNTEEMMLLSGSVTDICFTHLNSLPSFYDGIIVNFYKPCIRAVLLCEANG